jgi:mercuric ion binding protein
MKYAQLTIVGLFVFCLTTIAQQKTSGKAVINTPGMLSEECKTKIEHSLFKQYGIVAYKSDLKKKNVTVTWLTDRTDIEQIKTMIANVGFDADDVTADEFAYKNLSPTCKTLKVEETKTP